MENIKFIIENTIDSDIRTSYFRNNTSLWIRLHLVDNIRDIIIDKLCTDITDNI